MTLFTRIIFIITVGFCIGHLLMRILPTIEFVDEMPEDKINAIPEATKEGLVGCYTQVEREILILKGRGFKKTFFTILHELSHWVIDIAFRRQAKEKMNKWFDEHFTSKEV